MPVKRDCFRVGVYDVVERPVENGAVDTELLKSAEKGDQARLGIGDADKPLDKASLALRLVGRWPRDAPRLKMWLSVCICAWDCCLPCCN
jgi:hypothetical protein